MFKGPETDLNAQLALSLDTLTRSFQKNHVLLKPTHQPTETPTPGFAIRDFRSETIQAEKDYRHSITTPDHYPVVTRNEDIDATIQKSARVHILDRQSSAGRLVTVNLFPPQTTGPYHFFSTQEYRGTMDDGITFDPHPNSWLYTQDTINPNDFTWSTFIATLTRPNSQIEAIETSIKPNGQRSQQSHAYSYKYHTFNPRHR